MSLKKQMEQDAMLEKIRKLQADAAAQSNYMDTIREGLGFPGGSKGGTPKDGGTPRTSTSGCQR